MSAISHASMILNWQENLLEAEIPPRWMWTIDDEIADHFRQVKADRESGRDTSSDGPMTQNEYAKNRGRNAR